MALIRFQGSAVEKLLILWKIFKGRRPQTETAPKQACLYARVQQYSVCMCAPYGNQPHNMRANIYVDSRACDGSRVWILDIGQQSKTAA